MDGVDNTGVVTGRLRKYAGLLAALTAAMNVALGGFLLYAWLTASDHVCATEVPRWMLVSAIISLAYGCGFSLYALRALIAHIRRLGYSELDTSQVRVPRVSGEMCF